MANKTTRTYNLFDYVGVKHKDGCCECGAKIRITNDAERRNHFMQCPAVDAAINTIALHRLIELYSTTGVNNNANT